MSTSATFTSYIASITDEQFAEILSDVDAHDGIRVDVTIDHLRSRQIGYGTWRLVGDFTIAGEKVTMGSDTHDEHLVLALGGSDRDGLDYTSDEADAAALRQIVTERYNLEYFTVEPSTSA